MSTTSTTSAPSASALIRRVPALLVLLVLTMVPGRAASPAQFAEMALLLAITTVAGAVAVRLRMIIGSQRLYDTVPPWLGWLEHGLRDTIAIVSREEPQGPILEQAGASGVLYPINHLCNLIALCNDDP